MSDRKPFALRIDREVLDAVARWAADDLRSINGQIEHLLRQALREAGRLGRTPQASVSGSSSASRGSGARGSGK